MRLVLAFLFAFTAPAFAAPPDITQPTTIYVSTTGNDANDGSEAAPLRNPQAALDRATSYCFNKHKVTIDIGPGTFEPYWLVWPWYCPGDLDIVGAGQTSTIIASSEAGARGFFCRARVRLPGTLTIKDMRFDIPNGVGIWHGCAGIVVVKDVTFGDAITMIGNIDFPSYLIINGLIGIDGSAQNFLQVDAGPVSFLDATVSISGTRTFQSFLLCKFMGMLAAGATFYGNVSESTKRFSLGVGCRVDNKGQAFPGAPGTFDTGSFWAGPQ